ncbi:MAG: ATP synthase F0 subunit C [Deltaproteobacteria bacterium]|nr:ATP synthase F0 subunit C [Deltaproteobacteria bacterium]MBW1912198.1 ATP synthase F0 subunit C [Deltaproteobacteria bacterium]
MDIDAPTAIKLASFVGAGFCMGLGAIGAALGEGYTGGQASQAISQKPDLVREIVKSMLIGQALAESAGVFALVIAVLLIFMDMSANNMLASAALLGAGLSMGLGALGSGIGAGFPAGAACLGIARQPKLSSNLTTNMLIGSAVCQTPAIFSMVVALMLMFMDFGNLPLSPSWAALLGAGMCMGFGAIGSGIGSGFPAGEACLGIARQPAMIGRLTTNMLIGSAVCQTPAIFSLVVALMLMFMDFGHLPVSLGWAALLGASISTGLASIGSGFGGGYAAGAGCEAIARQPESFSQVTPVMLVGQAVSQTPCIFGLLISFILMFRAAPESTALSASMALLGAGISMGFGGIGPGIGNGLVAQGAIKWVGRKMEASGELMRTMLVGQAVSQSTAIYAMVVSLVLLFVV